jgi:hypothetical protein
MWRERLKPGKEEAERRAIWSVRTLEPVWRKGGEEREKEAMWGRRQAGKEEEPSGTGCCTNGGGGQVREEKRKVVKDGRDGGKASGLTKLVIRPRSLRAGCG